MKTEIQSDVIVIGAGPGGLASAMLLAAQGARVTIIERLNKIGGRSSAIESDGFRFDTGPTFFLYPRVLAEIFAACGRKLEDEVELIRLDPQYRLVFEEGGSIAATPDLKRMEAEIAKVSPKDAPNIAAFMLDNRKKLEAFRPALEREFNSARDFFAPDMLRSLKLIRPHLSVDQDLRRYFADPRIRLAFSFQSKYLGMSPFKCPSMFTILSFLEYEYGVFHPKGGCAAVMEAMGRIAKDLGVDIKLGEPVEEILFTGRRAVGVRTNKASYKSDAIVLNSDFAASMQQMVPDRLRRRWSDKGLAKKRYSCSTFMLYLGLKGRYDQLDHHTIFLTKNYLQNFNEIEQSAIPPRAPSFYVQNAVVTDPSLAKDGYSTLYVLVPVGHDRGRIDWPQIAPAYREQVLDRLQAIGLDDLRERIVFEKMVTPVDWRDDHAIYRGATFNLSHTLGQMMHRRPRNRFEELDRVYLVGGGTHPGSGLPVIFESARITSRLLAADLGYAKASAQLPRNTAGVHNSAIAEVT